MSRAAGFKTTEETKQRMRFAKLGKRPSIETRRKLSVCKTGHRHPNWKGGEKIKNATAVFYKMLYRPFHPKADRGYVAEHVLIAESALGRIVPEGSPVHHANGDSLENRNSNLVICQNHSYHRMLHGRLNAFKATGDPSRKKCSFCKSWEGEIIRRNYGGKSSNYHRKCFAEYQIDNKNRRLVSV